MVNMFIPLLITALITAAAPLQAQATAQQAAAPRASDDTANIYARKSLHAVRLGGDRPAIDGRLDEAVWRMAPAGTDFVQFKPNPGKLPSQKTEFRIAYDDDAIYVGARMFDTHPDSIVAQLARRDNDVYSEWFIIGFDSYFDRRTAFAFGVNPKGVKLDVFLYDDTNDDESWDAVWDVAARVDSLGWTAEFRIPFSQLRYSASDKTPDAEIIWGLNVLHKLARLDEESFWSPIRADGNALVSAFGELRGIAGLKSPRRLEVMPYSMSRLVRAPAESNNPFYKENDATIGAGADLKLGVTSDLTLTATINPDFGQVEADPSEVNLTAYETFFDEKRPFFVEGFDIFRAGIGAGDDNSEGLFYSRRIGRSPQGSAPDEAEFVNAPQAATILGAAKLSGKTRNGWSVGAMSALTGRETAEYFDGDGHHGEAVVEPLTHYAVGRVLKDFAKGQSAVGAIITATNRQLTDELKFLRANAYAAGVNARHRWQSGNYSLSGWLVGTRVDGDTAAINRTQRSSARYFQRPDNDHTRYDPTRTSLAGAGGGVEFMKMGGGNWRYAAMLNVRSPGFEVNDLGYMRGADQILQAAFVGYQQTKPGKRFDRWNVNLNQWVGFTTGGENNAIGGNINGSAQLKNKAEFWLGVNREQQALSEGATRGGPALLRPGSIRMHGGYDSDERKAFNWQLSLNYSNEDDTDGHSIGIYPSTRLRVSNQLELRLRPGISLNKRAWQYVSTESSSTGDQYIFATLDQVTTSLTARVSYTFTPNLSLQIYAEPFISAGDYSGFKRVTNPRADKFADRFAPASYDDNPDFNFRALRSNAVLRWEYRPGSALFLVWSQGREASDEYGDYRFGRDTGRLFDAPSTNVLLIKASYWLGL